MERWRNGIENQPPKQHCRNYPSFSSTLLDSIYRSIDETDSHGATTRQHLSSSSPSSFSHNKKKTTCFSENRRIIPPTTSLPPIRTTPTVRLDRSHPDQFASSRIDEKKAKKDRQASIKSYIRELRSGRSPSSPGARLTNFLSSIFAAKSKVSAELPCNRSCLSKTPSTGKRTVRFCPVSVIVGEDCRPCGEKWVLKNQGMKKKLEEEEEEEEEEEDLFELKNLAFIGRFRDELPVYETTLLGKCSGVSRGLVL